jgi:15-cis-phytoene synthase
VKSAKIMLNAPQNLALAYTPAAIRPAFAVHLALDNKWRGIFETGREPLIGQMKLAWWREALEKPENERPKGEPLLAVLAAAGHPMLLSSALQLLDAWEAIITHDADDRAGLAELSTEYGKALFGGYASLAGFTDCGKCQQLAGYYGVLRAGEAVDVMAFNICRAKLRKRNWRPLTILATAAYLESLEKASGGAKQIYRGLRLLGHAMTGR